MCVIASETHHRDVHKCVAILYSVHWSTCTPTCSFKHANTVVLSHSMKRLKSTPNEKTGDASINHFATHTFMRSVQVASFWQGLLRHSSMLISQCVPWKPVSEQLHAYLHASKQLQYSVIQPTARHACRLHVDPQWTLYNTTTYFCPPLTVSLARGVSH